MKSSVVRGLVGLALVAGGGRAALGESSATLNVARGLHYSQDEIGGGQPQATAPVLDATEQTWSVIAEPGAWLPWDVEGTATVKNVSADIHIKPHQLFDDADTYAGNMRVEFWNTSGWGVFGEVQYLSFDGDDFSLEVGGVPIATLASLEIEHFVADLGAGFRLVDAPSTNESEGWGTLDVFAGLRYQELNQEIYANPNQRVAESENFFEPMFGVRTVIGINEDVSLTFRGDFSGFYVGDGSDFTWTLLGGVLTRVSPRFDLHFTYRIFDVDYNDKSGADSFGLNMTFSGPFVGGVIRF